MKGSWKIVSVMSIFILFGSLTPMVCGGRVYVWEIVLPILR